MELESIPYQRFRQVEKFLENPVFDEKRIKQYSSSLHHLVSWIMGNYTLLKKILNSVNNIK